MKKLLFSCFFVFGCKSIEPVVPKFEESQRMRLCVDPSLKIDDSSVVIHRKVDVQKESIVFCKKFRKGDWATFMLTQGECPGYVVSISLNRATREIQCSVSRYSDVGPPFNVNLKVSSASISLNSLNFKKAIRGRFSLKLEPEKKYLYMPEHIEGTFVGVIS